MREDDAPDGGSDEGAGPDEIDLVALARGAERGARGGEAERTDAAQEAPDSTLGGYMERHDRPPAFEGTDGQPYTVDIAFDAAEPPVEGVAAYFVFLRWAETGAGIMGHLDSADVATGDNEDHARERALALPLKEVKAALDAAIRRRAEDNAP